MGRGKVRSEQVSATGESLDFYNLPSADDNHLGDFFLMAGRLT